MNEEEFSAFFAGVERKECQSSLIPIELIRQHRKNMLNGLLLTEEQRRRLEELR